MRLPNLRLTASALCALTALLGPAAPARAAAIDAPPISISTCSGGVSSVELVELASYDVTFHNSAGVTADDVRLSIPYGRRRIATFDVQGPFDPQVDVNKKLRKTLNGGLYAWRSDHNDCRVDYVHFTDGSSWSRS